MKTGECTADRKLRLKKYDVVTKGTTSMSSAEPARHRPRKPAPKPAKRGASVKPLAAAKPAAKPVSKPLAKAPRTDRSQEAKRLAEALDQALAEGVLDVLSHEALQALLAALCKNYSARIEAGEDFLPVSQRGARHPDRRHGDREQIVEIGQSAGLRARHVAELDRPLARFERSPARPGRRLIMDMISDRGRRVSVEELNTTKLLAHAQQQAQQRKYDDIMIVDVDAQSLREREYGGDPPLYGE